MVEGSVQVTLNRTRAIEIAETGRFTNGKAEVDEAEIAGVYEGSLTVRKRLLIRATGRVSGNVRYGEIEIERGGRLSGSIERLPEEPLRAVHDPARRSRHARSDAGQAVGLNSSSPADTDRRRRSARSSRIAAKPRSSTSAAASSGVTQMASRWPFSGQSSCRRSTSSGNTSTRTGIERPPRSCLS